MDHHKTSPDLEHFLFFARQGHYPLFFSEWIQSSLSHAPQGIHLHEARTCVEHIFLKLEKHRPWEKKKIYLMSLPEPELKIFIRSFFRLVESSLLHKDMPLH
ncbi:MAG: hypothetical protein KBD63_01500 [Bacteriovoracaceae bacterium]|nr:hypothetical protein [Bacteriovoracaceae bacterium]